ncbi:Coenzyme F420 hydrogenase/dehydrogenase, beta subunit C-terminal domain [Halomicroarcula sp. S1AR25-4]|uniref:Coenzyme F420 hydrogenase/dehydrogenase, beta subunit C-terminal domain n=1 Tax=Haloarcula sp. S1AR25-4 TaxID=2950538 RepID=UPI00287635A1|nr:Coenzyme F420 hydrogenase/dehydrogenase, beta subunit C-terminal domain [Halomicroarcula sp. S1AR25-4]MDS0278622.1 Coenzyme F420 hydrogenase/dehydrogenase, beta subunit C-terminal domain [Halomicroarcula sp. S1AR25-4]
MTDDERERGQVAPADAAPELIEGAPSDECDDDRGERRLVTDGGRDTGPLPGVPSTDSADAGCGCGDSCGCGGHDEAVRPDGGATASNVDERGKLKPVEFTEPAAGVSQDVEDGRPDERVNVPDGVELDTPGYGIRAEMSDIEEPDRKTWFMELDEAVIQNDRCIQCGTCVAACPSDSIGIGEDDLPKLVKMCTGCSLCWDMCPRGGLRYERQWKITGGEDNVKGAGDPITEFSAKVEDDWRENAQDGGLVTSVLCHLLEADEIDGALIATESDEEPWKAESFLATTPEECIENAGSFYNQTLALGNLDLSQWAHKLGVPLSEASLALVGTPCEIEGIRALQDFEWDYAAQEDGVRAIDYTIALMCTKNFNYYSLIGEQLAEKRDVQPEDIGKLDVLDGEMRVYDHDGDPILVEDVEAFHDAALKGCDECADFTGYCADLTVGSVGSSDEYSSVIVRTEQGLRAWELTEPDLDYHDLEDRSAIGGLQSWDKKKAFESLERPFDPDAPRFIDYADHAEQYGTELHPHEADH